MMAIIIPNKPGEGGRGKGEVGRGKEKEEGCENISTEY